MLKSNSITQDDFYLSAFIKERNQQSLEYFYDKYSPALYGIIYRIINDNYSAEECLKKTFMKAWNELSTTKPSAISIFSWLLSLARQVSFEYLKNEKEKLTVIHGFETGHGRNYSTFELIYLKGLNFKQVAELSGLTLTQIKTHLRMDLKIGNNITQKGGTNN